METFFFNRDTLLERGKRSQGEYQSAEPFPSIVLDGFLPEVVAKKAAAEFGSPEGFKQPDNAFQKFKRERVHESGFAGVSPFLRNLLNEFHSLAFLDFLEALTGIQGLIPDPHLVGGGLHQTLPGGKLAVHADFNLDPRRKLVRRVNVLVYFNPDWEDAYQGHLELWDKDVKSCVKKIAPILNRCVIFSTSETSFHGHPEPLACPEGRCRNSFAFYYYTVPEETRLPAEHTTLWKSRPGIQEPSGEGDRRHQGRAYELGRKILKEKIKPWIPPIVAEKFRPRSP